MRDKMSAATQPTQLRPFLPEKRYRFPRSTSLDCVDCGTAVDNGSHIGHKNENKVSPMSQEGDKYKLRESLEGWIPSVETHRVSRNLTLKQPKARSHSMFTGVP